MTSQEQLFRPGDRCGPYEINAFLARGGMGEVYLGTHAFNGREAAIKVLQLSHTGDARALARIRQEATFLCKLNHPNIVTTYDSNITEDGTIWIAMERLQGESLREIVSRQALLPPSIALGMVSDVTRGVAAAHELDAIHRDLKPENIYVTVDGKVKVLDFGIAKFGSYELKNTDPGRGPVGTPFYMSPEQIQGLRVDPRSDVYSLGLVLYELLAGHHPFLPQGPYERLPDFRQLTAWHLQRDPIALSTIIPGLPEEVYDVVATALRKNPDERFANMDDFGRALRAARREVIALDPAAPTRWAGNIDADLAGQLDRADEDAIPRSVPNGAKQSSVVIHATVLRAEPVRVTTMPTPLAPPERRRIVADTIKDSAATRAARGFRASWAALFRTGAMADSRRAMAAPQRAPGPRKAAVSRPPNTMSALAHERSAETSGAPPYRTRAFWLRVGGLGAAFGVPAGVLLATVIHLRGGDLGGLHRQAHASAPTAASAGKIPADSAIAAPVPRAASAAERAAPVRAELGPVAPPVASGPPGAVATPTPASTRPRSAATSAERTGMRPEDLAPDPDRSTPPKKHSVAGHRGNAGKTSTLVEPDWSPESLDNADPYVMPAASARFLGETAIP